MAQTVWIYYVIRYSYCLVEVFCIAFIVVLWQYISLKLLVERLLLTDGGAQVRPSSV